MKRRGAVLLGLALLLLLLIAYRERGADWGQPAPPPNDDSARGSLTDSPPGGAGDEVAPGSVAVPADPDAAAEPEARIGIFTGDFVIGGVVRDETGRALPGVTVSIEADTLRHDLPARRVEIRTDEVGAFLFAGLHEGTYSLSANAPLRQGVYRRFIPGGTTDIELVLKAGAELVVGVSPPEGPTAEEISKRLQVFLERIEDGDTWDDCDDAGTIEFKGLAPGRYRVQARVPGVGSGEIDAVTLEAGQRREVVVPLTEGTVLAGRVVDAETGAAVPGARVAALPESVAEDIPVLGVIHEDFAYWNGGAFAHADAEGRFRIVGLFPGAWTVGVRAPRHHPTEVGDVMLPAAAPLVVRMSAGGDLIVRVLDASGEPVPKLDVMVDLEGRGVFEAITDETGRCVIEGLPPGEQLVSVLDRGRSLHADVRVEPGREREVVLRFADGSAVLTGTVLRNGDPEPNRTVWVKVEGETRTARSDERGRYRIEDLPEGEADIRIDTRMRVRLPLPGILLLPGENRRDLVIPTGRATVVVTDRSTGAPLKGAVVVSRRGLWLQTDERGRAEILEMEGPVELFVSSERHAAAKVRVDPGGPPVRVELAAGATLSIRVVRPDGEEIPEPEVEVFAGDEEVGGVALVYGFALELSGRATFRLAPGEYRVRVAAEGYAPEELHVRLEPEGTERTVILRQR